MSEAIADLATVTSPDDAAGDDSPYVLKSRSEIVHVLRDLVRTRVIATVHLGGVAGSLVTPLIAVDDALSRIIFDGSGNEALNQSVLRAARLLFVAHQEKVKIRFSTAPASLVSWQGEPAFAAPIPLELLRLQRREFFRVLAPISRAVQCVVPVLAEDGRCRYVDARIYDIGLGGVAIIAQAGQIPAEPGTRYQNCRMVLPDAGPIVVTLEVRSTLEMSLPNGKAALRIGCRFVDPSHATSSMIQRYTMRLERERKRRE